MKTLKISAIAAAAFASAACGAARQPALFGNGETSVCFVGDSITHHGYYPKHIALYYITRYPNLQKKFFNAGFEGGSANTTNMRLSADIAPKNADIYTVMLGMNDVRHANFSEAALADKQKHEAKREENFSLFKTNMSKLVDSLQKMGKVVLMSSSIYDDRGDITNPIAVMRNGEIVPIIRAKPLRLVNAELNRYGRWCAQTARERGLQFADHWRETEAANKKVTAENPHSSAIGRNRVHPFDFGGFFTAYAFLKDIGETPTVSSVEIDCAARAAKTQNASASKLAFKNGGVSFELFESALPYPLTEKTCACTKYCGFFSDLDMQTLKVSNAPKDAAFELRIDGETAGFYTAAELARGVNLAENTLTPQAEQARKVERLVELWRERTQKVRDLFGTEFIAGIYQSPFTVAQKKAIVAEKLAKGKVGKTTVKSFEWYLVNIDKKDIFQKQADDAIAEAYKAAQPRPHKYEIVKIAPEAAPAAAMPAAPTESASAAYCGQKTVELRFAKNAARPMPCVIIFGVGAGAETLAQTLAENGFLAVSAPQDSCPLKAAAETFKILRWLEKSAAAYGANPAKIGVCGAAEGGAAAMLFAAAANNPKGFAAIAKGGEPAPSSPRPISACAAIESMHETTNPRIFNKIFACDYDKARAASAYEYLSANNPPTLLMHGMFGAETPPAETIKMARALAAAGANVKTAFYRGAILPLSKTNKNAQPALCGVAKFFGETLKK